jgi:hypothetical protein
MTTGIIATGSMNAIVEFFSNMTAFLPYVLFYLHRYLLILWLFCRSKCYAGDDSSVLCPPFSFELGFDPVCVRCSAGVILIEIGLMTHQWRRVIYSSFAQVTDSDVKRRVQKRPLVYCCTSGYTVVILILFPELAPFRLTFLSLDVDK